MSVNKLIEGKENMTTQRAYIILTAIFLSLYGSFCYAKNSSSPPSNDSTKETVTANPSATQDIKITKAEQKIICNKYKNKYISFVGTRVWKVTKNCLREKIFDLEKLRENKTKIIDVDARVLIAIKQKTTTVTITKLQLQKIQQKYEGQCIIHFDEIYFIKNGKKRAIDWPTLKDKKCKLVYLNLKTFNLLPEGEPFPSILSNRKLKSQINLEMIPRDPNEKLCKQLKDNIIYSYYQELYKKIVINNNCYIQKISFKQNIKENKQIEEIKSSDFLQLKIRPYK
jgi:hypothetical protein